MVTIAESIPNEECYTIKELAAELGVGTQQATKLVIKALKAGYTQNLVKSVGQKKLYAPQMVEKLKQARNEGKLGPTRQKDLTNPKNAELFIPVYIYDDELAEILKQQFDGGVGEMSRYLQDYLESEAKVIKAELQKIKAEAEQRKNQLIRSRRLFSTHRVTSD